METVTDPHERAGLEGAQIEGGHVEEATGGGVGGQQYLEAAVDPEAVDLVGVDPSAGSVPRLEDQRLMAFFAQPDRGRETSKAGTDHNHIVGAHALSSALRVTVNQVIRTTAGGRGLRQTCRRWPEVAGPQLVFSGAATAAILPIRPA